MTRTPSRLWPILSAFALLGAGLQASGTEQALVLQRGGADGSPLGVDHATPLEILVLDTHGAGSVEAGDPPTQTYLKPPAGVRVPFAGGGALGLQKVIVRDGKGDETRE